MYKHKNKDLQDFLPTKAALKFISFIKATGNEKFPSPPVHYKIADTLFSTKKSDRKVLIKCLRGIGKSTLVEYAVIYSAAMGEWPGFGQVPFIVFLGASQEGNVKQFFRNVANKIDRSDFLRKYIDVIKATDTELELKNKAGFITSIAGRGMNVNFRGIRSKYGDRPTLVIADDILQDVMATSDALRDTVETNWFNAVLPSLDPVDHKIIVIGTPISDKDLLAKIERSGQYAVAKYALCSKFPCKPEEFDSVWPERFTYEYAKSIYDQYKEAGKLQGFYQEYMLELTDLSDLLVEPEDIVRYDRANIDNKIPSFNVYITTDFAVSTKSSADYSTIGVWGITSNNDWILLDGQCKRQPMPQNIEDLFNYVRKYKPLAVGIEKTGQQGGFLDFIRDKMIEENTWFQLGRMAGKKEEGIRPTKDKLSRFVTGVQPKFKQNKIWIPKKDNLREIGYNNLYELVEELEYELGHLTMKGGVEKLKHDDAIDLLNQLSEMDKITPSSDYVAETSTKKVIDGLIVEWEEEEKLGAVTSNLIF